MDVTFSVKYKTDWGQHLCLLGDAPELGSWRVQQALKMQWTEGHFWKATVRFAPDQTFQYKYVVIGPQNNSRWEPGPNRIAKASDGDLRDAWDSMQVTLALYFPLRTPTEIMHVNGDPESIGQWESIGPVPMVLGTVPRRLPTEVDGLCWELSFYVPRTQTEFSYRYLVVDPRTDSALWEREPNRVFRLPPGTGIPSKTFRLDMNFASGLVYNKLTDFPIYIGPYPQDQREVRILAEEGITAVINLQSHKDLSYRRVNWPAMLGYYEEAGIQVVHHPTADFDREDLMTKLPPAAKILDELYADGKIIYVHCTAGMGRSPALVIYYLVKYHYFSIESAIKLVKECRPTAIPNEAAIREALV